MPVGVEAGDLEQCSAVYEALIPHHRDQALSYLMEKFGVEMVNQWLNWRWTEAQTLH